ncbi:MAG: type I restriction enzyme HsdR N-terminal domain-containing protein [Fibrobacter sp.]|nr:type I restriction enzyme HsdR N-terminal domain-containing protein [Fibrobacter sp.]
MYDPIRKKEVPDTPEEFVRQATIRYLVEQVKVSEHLIAVEFSLSTIAPDCDDRVDLIVQDFRAESSIERPWLLVECKAPGEYTWGALQVQLNKYLRYLKPKYVMLALGDAVCYFQLDTASNRFKKIDNLPVFR